MGKADATPQVSVLCVSNNCATSPRYIKTATNELRGPHDKFEPARAVVERTRHLKYAINRLSGIRLSGSVLELKVSIFFNNSLFSDKCRENSSIDGRDRMNPS